MITIISAQEAREQSMEVIDRDINSNLKEIDKCIKETCKQGLLSCTVKCPYEVSLALMNIIKSLGYSVEYGQTCYSQLDGYETDKKKLVISWK